MNDYCKLIYVLEIKNIITIALLHLKICKKLSYIDILPLKRRGTEFAFCRDALEFRDIP
jgi:hypothetical protein